MAYEKQSFENNTTVLSAEHMEHIEEGIYQNSVGLENLESKKLDAAKLSEATEAALEQAKASGEFDGEKGDDGIGIASIQQTTTSTASGGENEVTVTLTDGSAETFTVKNGSKGNPGTSVTVENVSESTADGGSNVVTFSDGKTLTVKNGSKGSTGEKGETGSPGSNGVSATHSWNGTTLTITSASGTSSANLKGEKGDKGDKGDSVKGDKGETGATGVGVSSVKQTTTSTADGGSNVVTVTLSNGTTSTFTVKNGSKGSTGATGSKGADGKTPVKGTDYWTPADQESIVQQVITALGTPVFGRVDLNKKVTITGDLADGTYTFSYVDKDGKETLIGQMVKGATNQIPISTDTDGSVYNGTGYKVNTRGNSSGTPADFDPKISGLTPFFTGFIPAKQGDVIRLKNCFIEVSNSLDYSTNGGTGYWGIRSGLYNSSKAKIDVTSWGDFIDGSQTKFSNYTIVGGKVTEFTIAYSGVAYVRLTLATNGNPADAIVTVNEEIN